MHHSRRKSGHGSMTDVRKAASASDAKHRSSSSKQTTSSNTHTTHSSRRPGTTQSSSKSASKHGSSRDQDEDSWYDDERESFPQFCMTCEKQFVAKDDRFLYCSEACRDYDQEHGASISTQHFKDSYISSRIYAHQPQEPRDIIPRASPSRPSSTYYSHPASGPAMSSTMPNASTSSAMAALRSLSLRDASPPSPTTAPSSSGIWPFSSSSRSTAASPSNSYTQPATVYATTYDHGYYRTGAPNYYSYGSESAGFHGAGASTGAGSGADRPLPPRRPGSYSRPKSIELVTPLLGQ